MEDEFDLKAILDHARIVAMTYDKMTSDGEICDVYKCILGYGCASVYRSLDRINVPREVVEHIISKEMHNKIVNFTNALVDKLRETNDE